MTATFSINDPIRITDGYYKGQSGKIAGQVYLDPSDGVPVCLVIIPGIDPAVAIAIADLEPDKAMIVGFNELYLKHFTYPYFILEENHKDKTTYRVCWAARLTDGKISNEHDWCYLSGEYHKPEAAQRRLPTLRTRNEASQQEPECPEGYFWNGRQCLRESPWPTLTTYEREGF